MNHANATLVSTGQNVFTIPWKGSGAPPWGHKHEQVFIPATGPKIRRRHHKGVVAIVRKEKLHFHKVKRLRLKKSD